MVGLLAFTTGLLLGFIVACGLMTWLYIDQIDTIISRANTLVGRAEFVTDELVDQLEKTFQNNED